MAGGILDPGSVTLITGVSAAGKSTVAELLARRAAKGVPVRGHVFRRMVVAGRCDPAPSLADEARRQLRLRYELAVEVANRYSTAGFATVVQDVIFGELG